MVSPSDICKNFVDRDALDELRVIVKDRNGRIEDEITHSMGGFVID